MKAIPLTEGLHDYVVAHSPLPLPLKDLVMELAEETSKLPYAMMRISPDQASLMHFLVKLTGAKRVVEVGCFTGTSALAMGAALPEDGELVTLDVDEETTSIARRYFKKAGLEKRIEVRLGQAADSMDTLHKHWGAGTTDMVFIDADKENYLTYYEKALVLLRRGGMVICDNVLWSGKVVDHADERASTTAIRRFNDRVKDDERVDRVMLHVADGLYLLRKR